MAVSKVFSSGVKAFQAYLEQTGKGVFTPNEILRLFETYAASWGFPSNYGARRIIDKIVAEQLLRIQEITYSKGGSVQRYIYDDPSVHAVATSLRTNSYISHYPALFLQQLTEQEPKTIYCTHELTLKQPPKNPQPMLQESIDNVFAQPQRRKELTAGYGEFNIVLLEGKFTGGLGVYQTNGLKNNFSLTNMERTLIDSMVRPNYAGGAFQVLEAFKHALTIDVSINKIMAFLSQLNFIYPYQQALGFYLERAGYSGKFTDVLKKQRSQYRFYLDYAMEDISFSQEWQLYYPKGM